MTERSREAVAADLATELEARDDCDGLPLQPCRITWPDSVPSWCQGCLNFTTAALLRTPPAKIGESLGLSENIICTPPREAPDAGTQDDGAGAGNSMADAAEMLWVVLANVSGGDWNRQSPEWQEAAARWRDNYFAALKVTEPPPPGVDGGSVASPETDHTGNSKSPPREAKESEKMNKPIRVPWVFFSLGDHVPGGMRPVYYQDRGAAGARVVGYVNQHDVEMVAAALEACNDEQNLRAAALDLTPLTALVAQWEEQAHAEPDDYCSAIQLTCASQLAAVLATMQKPG